MNLGLSQMNLGKTSN